MAPVAGQKGYDPTNKCLRPPSRRLLRRNIFLRLQNHCRSGTSLCGPRNRSDSRLKASNEQGHLNVPELLPLADEGAFEVAHKVGSLCNWLIPGRVLVGRYPYIEPSRCFDRKLGERQLEALLNLGVNVFVCLQAELPPQEQLPTRGVKNFMSYKPLATMMYSSMGTPPSVEMTGSIRNSHLDKFLPPRRQEQTRSSDKTRELQFLHSPIPDLGVPDKRQFRRVTRLLEDLCNCLQEGSVIYLHCWGGRGRAGTIGACLLARIYNIDADEALERVQRAFNTREDNKSHSPETDGQIAFVRMFISNMQ